MSLKENTIHNLQVIEYTIIVIIHKTFLNKNLKTNNYLNLNFYVFLN